MPAPKKAPEGKKADEAPDERAAPPPPTPSKGKDTTKDANELPGSGSTDPTPKKVPKPELPKLRPREWFDHILPNKKGEGFLGLHSREIPQAPKGKDEE